MADNMFDLTGKVILMTGAAGILGKVFCQALARYGASLALVDLHQDAVEDAVAILKDGFPDINAVGFVCDVSDEASVSIMVNSVVEHFGRIDVLHNNAASKSSDLKAFFAPFEEYETRIWREVMSVNIDGMFLVAQAVGRQMKRQGNGGSMIMTSSIYGIVGPDQRIYEGSEYLGVEINTPAVYSTSKAAVIGLAQYLSTWWGADGIRVNILTPGGMESGQNDRFCQQYAARVPMGRMGQPKELQGTLVYLCSDASSYVTGQNFIIDGGLTVW